MRYPKLFLGFIIFFFVGHQLMAQSIRINEVSPANNTFLDEDGDTEDWIELYNPMEEAINLENWSITDNISEPEKWLFPAYELAPKEFLTIFASNKDRTELLTYKTVIQQGDECKFIIPNFSTSANWRTIDLMITIGAMAQRV